MSNEDWEDGDSWEDCGLMPDGQCLKAGSEDCDFGCPYSHGPYYAGSQAWHKRHNEGAPLDGCECNECAELRRANYSSD